MARMTFELSMVRAFTILILVDALIYFQESHGMGAWKAEARHMTKGLRNSQRHVDQTEMNVNISSMQQQCGTGNVIDDCWRCNNSFWEKDRKKLADCAVGFGGLARGGKDGEYYTVNNSEDDPIDPRPGSLRHAVIQETPLWIVFERDMVINLKAELMISSFKTIDGRGAQVHITGFGCITVQRASNVIIHGIHIHDCQPGPPTQVITRPGHLEGRDISDGDGISIHGASEVWVDHCSLSNCTDGLIDIILNSTRITISNNLFTQHDKVMLLGHNDDDKSERSLRVTVVYNYFGKGLIQRMPRCRHGHFHVVNNYYDRWGLYAIGGSASPTILSQGNLYFAPDDPSKKKVTRRQTPGDEWRKWNWTSDGDLFQNGAVFLPSGSSNLGDYKSTWSMEAKPASMVPSLTSDAGVL